MPPFPNPFDAGEPHPLARAAAERLMAQLRAGRVSRALLEGPEGGKMFGVLVAEDRAGAQVELHAFSGLLGGQWLVEGFAPPAFDAGAREAIEVPGEREVKRLWALHRELSSSPALRHARERLAELTARHAEALAALDAKHQAAKQDRDRRREGASEAQLEALAQQSRREKTARRWLLEKHQQERAAAEAPLRRLERRLAASDRLRTWFSRRLMRAIHDTYLLPNFRGESTPLRALSRGEPPSGAGDCAAPKLLACAARQGLHPLALAEFWWGTPPPNSPRAEGQFAPACRHKCGLLLPFMLQGLDVAAPRGLGEEPGAAALAVLYRDAHLLAVEKPEGLLAVPGRVEGLQDSLQSRLRAQFPGARLAHRLDLDTSGVVLAALDEETYRALQAQFAARTVEKRYVAWLAGAVERDQGRIELPLRVDLEDRPRQLVDPVHGKHAVTLFRVLERQPGRTRVELRPLTGRTHQLRVHAAHPLGLGAPIEGDRLYGARGGRLKLHAESISFRHPATGEEITVHSRAGF